MANFVQLYKSTDANAPSLTGQVGSLITLLNKCLVDGYSTASVTSIVESGTTYTVTLAAANSSLVSGNYVTISGASPSGANGTFKITVTSTTTFTYVGPGGLGTITGTILYAKAALQWARPFSAGTNSQTYRSADATSNRFYLQVIDNGATAGGAKEAQIYGAEVMSADQTVTSGQFPTTVQQASGLCLRKSTTADSTVRAWTLWGDDRTFYLQTTTGDVASQANHSMGFGHFISYKAGDAYNTFIGGGASFNSSNVACGMGQMTAFQVGPAGNAMYIARSYTQLGTSVQAEMLGVGISSNNIVGGLTLITYPNGPDSGLHVAQLQLSDAVGVNRGRMPGMYQPLHLNPLTQYDESTGVTGLSGVTLVTVNIVSSGTLGQLLVDKFGPWA
jgi:hypothetical protein